ncbi:MAG: biotin--[acetyl-CoA-carboxylase] ligase [Planctomycetes bacterium]|nr:biotin--[acetyl-CoA-carboxylase] ligase [Planctomycetota bacterium]
MSSSTDSTNLDARRLIESLGGEHCHGFVVTTSRQQAGRGTRGRRWWSPPGASLAVSIILSPQIPLEQPALLTLVAALAVVRTGESAGARLLLKWPNDVVDASGAKVAGILAETMPAGRPAHVIGIGVNLSPPRALPEHAIDGRIGTVIGAGGREMAAGGFLQGLLRSLEGGLEELERGGAAAVISAFNRISWLRGRLVTLRRGAEERCGRFLEMAAPLDVVLDQGPSGRLVWPAAQVELLAVDSAQEQGT